VVREWWRFLLTCNVLHCSCIGYLVILHENYKLLCLKSRIRIKITCIQANYHTTGKCMRLRVVWMASRILRDSVYQKTIWQECGLRSPDCGSGVLVFISRVMVKSTRCWTLTTCLELHHQAVVVNQTPPTLPCLDANYATRSSVMIQCL